jgi:hypothetical protein
LGRFFNAYSDQAIVTVVLDTWGNRSTAEILDYVYFQTEPMEHGVRNERLDFSKISNDISERYRRSASGKTKKEIAKLRADFRKKSSALHDRQFSFTPPRYDDDFLKALEKLDSGNL